MSKKPFVNVWLSSAELGVTEQSSEAVLEYGDGPCYFDTHSDSAWEEVVEDMMRSIYK